MSEINFTADMIKSLLALRHPPGEWVLIYELSNGTGYNPKQRYIDAFAFNCYPSKNNIRIAYEIKVSRSDFVNELKHPEKRQWAMDVCHQFYFACAPGVAEKSEIPEGCGLLVATKNANMMRVQLHARQKLKPRPLQDNEIAAMLRAIERINRKDLIHWKYAGRDLTDDDLLKLIEEKRDWLEKEEIEKKVNQGVNESLSKLKSIAESYVEAFEGAQVVPPGFIKQLAETGCFHRDWHISRWLEENIAPGPGLIEVQRAEKALTDLRKELDRAHNHIKRLKDQTVMSHNEQIELKTG